MLKIAIIVPEDLIDIADIAAKEAKTEITILKGSMSEGIILAKDLEQKEYDVIIARGGTEELLIQSEIKIPTVPIPITPVDIFRLEEGIEKVWERHGLMAKAVRNAVKTMRLEFFADKKVASDTVTAIYVPEGIKYKELAELLRTQYNVVIGGGLQKLQGKVFRIGHMGAINSIDIIAVIGAVEMALYQLGYKIELGTAAKAVSETLLNKN